jgi:hypothetical protein
MINMIQLFDDTSTSNVILKTKTAETHLSSLTHFGKRMTLGSFDGTSTVRSSGSQIAGLEIRLELPARSMEKAKGSLNKRKLKSLENA